MLEKLGNALKSAFEKIASAVFVDKEIPIIIRELQRALIEADVNVQFVKELSEKIKKEAEKKIKGIEKKEHIIKLIHDEFLEILGKEKHELQFEKKHNLVMLVGLYGCGKCVHGESKIQLSTGEIINAEKLYENYQTKLSEVKLKDGKIINISRENLVVPSFNPETCKIENKKATHLWKLNKKDLMEIKIDNGNDFSIKVTPEHPFFVLRNGKVEKVRADEIKEEDFIAIPNKISIEGETQSLFDDIKNLNFYAYFSPDETKEIISNYKTLKEACENLRFKKNYCQLTTDIKRGKIPIELIDNNELNFLRIKEANSEKIISFPLCLTGEFAEFLGYLMGDGHIGKNYAEIASEDEEVIKRVIELSKILFNITPSIKRDTRTRNLHKIILCSKTLVKALSIFNLKPGKKGKSLEIPKQIFLSSNETIKQYIRAYFDCDSYPSNNRNIELTSESKVLIQQMSLLLERFGILSAVSKKVINNVPYWRLVIKAKYAEIYAEKIGYLIAKKSKKANKYKEIGIIQGYGNQDMIPLGKTLRELRLNLGFSIGEIQTNAVYSYGRYEEKGIISRGNLLKLVEYYKNKQTGIFLKFLEYIKNNVSINEFYSRGFINGIISYLKKENWASYENKKIIISEKGSEYITLIKTNKLQSQNLLVLLEFLATSNVCWLPIKEIKNIENNKDYVYDLTVEDNHSFIAEGFIVHNTTTIAKLASYYQKRGKKTAILGLDVHRPAASEQLEQLAKANNLKCFINKKEKNALKIWQSYEKELKDFELVIIDTAGRHSLDKELEKELKELAAKISPDYTILVMPADIGQAARQQAEQFKKACSINGVIITRMDSSAKGGGALSACKEVNAPVFFIGTGEKIHDIESFNPSAFISRILGLGDLESLIEKVKAVTDTKKLKETEKRLKEGKLTLLDVQEQLKSMQGLSLSKITELIPGFSKLKSKVPDGVLGSQEEKLKKWQHIINSMTREEIEKPEIIEKQTSRLGRIAKGSGTTTSEIRQLLKQFKILKDFSSGKMGGLEDMDMSSGFSQKQMQKLARKFGKKIRI